MKHDTVGAFEAAFAVKNQRSTPKRFDLSRPYSRVGKRLMDICASLFLLVVFAPVFLVVALSSLFSKGRMIYAQPRIGRGGRVYKCYKFRTMVENAETRLAELRAKDPEIDSEWRKFQKLKNDPRITRLGKFLRKSSLDELPQLLNVLKGDMSVVGPRPFTADQIDLYSAAGGRAYYALRPGITGAWQVAERNGSEFVTRVSYDEAYAKRLSAFLDIRILFLTVFVVIKGTGH